MIYKPNPQKRLEVFVDADYASGWDPADALNADNVYSCTGYVIFYVGCHIFSGRASFKQDCSLYC